MAIRRYAVELINDSFCFEGPGWLGVCFDIDGVDLGRALYGLPLLVAHDLYDFDRTHRAVIGNVVEIRKDEARLMGVIEVDPDDDSRVAELVADWDDDRNKQVSIGADVMDYNEISTEGEDLVGVEVTRWRPFELSVVSVGAVNGARVIREIDKKVD